jgi:tetratricopeptide (TPR) repeat protein
MIGRGSYGDVWLARGVTGVLRAIKIVWRERFDDAEPFEREFSGLREFAAISLREDHQLAVVHVGKNDAEGFFYYVMELADDATTGRHINLDRYVPHTLDLVRRRGRLPAEACITLGVELSQALAGLHACGLVHRDIKPANVIFVDGVSKLADIGLVATTAEARTYVGTDGFIPPEGPGTPAADVFSLGKVLYEVFTGFDRKEYPRLPADLDALPDRKALLELNEIIVRACEPVPGDRYRSAEALLVDLHLLQRGKSIRRIRANQRRRTAALWAGVIVAIAGAGAALQYVAERRAGLASTANPEVDSLLARAEGLSDGIFTRNGITLADDLARRATDLAPDSARAWGIRAHCSACFLQRGWDTSTARRQEVQDSANHALTMDPNQPHALLALAILLDFQGAYGPCETIARRGLAVQPDDPRFSRVLSRAIYSAGRKQEGLALAQANARRFPRDPMVHYELAQLYGENDDFDHLEASLATALALKPFQAGLISQVAFLIERKGDLKAARATFEQIDAEDRSDDRVVAIAMYLGLLERRPDRVRDAAAVTANSYLTNYVTREGPKATWLALSYQQEGKPSLEQAQWQETEAVLREHLQEHPEILTDHARLATTLVRLGRREEAAREIAAFEAAARDQPSIDKAIMLAVYYAALGDATRTLPYLKQAMNRWGGVSYYFLRLHPWWDKLRGQPEFDQFLAAARPPATAPDQASAAPTNL